MPKTKRRGRIPTPAWEHQGTLGRTLAGRSPQFYATAGIIMIIVAAAALIGYGFYSDWQAGRNRPGSTAIQVDATAYTVRYYTERMKMFIEQFGGPSNQNSQPSTVMPLTSEALTREALYTEFASEKGISASADDIHQEITARLGIAADDANFDSRYQQELTTTELSDAEYKQMVTAAVLQKKLTTEFTNELPPNAESVHYRLITVADQATASELKAQIEGGADFAQLAKDKSTDAATKDKGGDAGWVARGVAAKGLEDALFALDVNQVSTFPLSSGADVLQVLEKQADRPLENAQKTQLGQKALNDWLGQKRSAATVQNEMDLNTGDNDKIKWAVDHAYPA